VSVAPDGSPVELYELLPARGEGDVVAAAVPPPATLLELGCGVGRVTRQLVRLGYTVTAVDESPEMLARVSDAETVRARIEDLDLGRRFDAVLLLSNLLTVEPPQRRAFLDACARHADLLVVETLPLAWRPDGGESVLGEVAARLHVDRIENGIVQGAMEYRAGDRTWRHAFSMRVFADEAELAAALAEGGWRLDRWLDRDRGWFAARRER
jgi:SAM-dependent methyltransferase